MKPIVSIAQPTKSDANERAQYVYTVLIGDAKPPAEVKQCEYVFSGFYEISKLQILDNIVCNHLFNIVGRIRYTNTGSWNMIKYKDAVLPV